MILTDCDYVVDYMNIALVAAWEDVMIVVRVTEVSYQAGG